MKKIIIIVMITLLIAALVGCQNSVDKKKEGDKGVVWSQGEGGQMVLLLVKGSKATALETFDNILEHPATVGDVYEIAYDSKDSDDNTQLKEMTLFATAAENKEIYTWDINRGEPIKKENPDVYLLDVRTEAEYRQCHLEGSLLLPVDELKERAYQELPNKKTPVLLYCRSGNRSAQAAVILKEQGYNLVIDLGGIQGYRGNLIK
ncbi:MAG: rhodanese-like domain-containing protein [Eubacteriaceae bacterium]|jgi:rhodanese-related sulfurtransferase|nr:rhodanese-like domain-containing protein [Eubacteriaceae bacterium]